MICTLRWRVAALDDAGLTFADVDGIAAVGNLMQASELAEHLGVRPRWVDNTMTGGSSFEVLVQHAVAAIACDMAEVVLVVYGETPRGDRSRPSEVPVLGAAGHEHPGVGGPVRHPPVARAVRARDAAAHALLRHDARAVRRDRGVDAAVGGDEPEREVAGADHDRRRARVALRGRARAPPRGVPRDRRRRRVCGHVGGAWPATCANRPLTSSARGARRPTAS